MSEEVKTGSEETKQEAVSEPVVEVKEDVRKESKKETSTSGNKAKGGRIVVVLVRGIVGVTQKVKDTLTFLNLSRKNHCSVIDGNPINEGMLQKVKDYATWGEIDDSTFKELVEKRGEEYKGRTSDRKGKYHYKTLDVSGKKYKKYFRLNPPRKGFGRKGVKMAFKVGGALGYRGDKINDLIRRML